MCDRYAQITSEEPQVWMFEHQNCQGAGRALPFGLTNDLNGGAPASNQVTSMVIPPHVYVEATTHPWNVSMTYPYAGHITSFAPEQGRIFPDLGAARASYDAGKGGLTFYRGWNDDFDGVNVVRRQSWDSWKDQCCKNQIDDSVCPAGFMHPNDSNCYNYMNAYCSAGANMWDGLCAQWGPVESKKQEYCNTGPHFAEQRCKEWCTKRNPDGTVNFGKCDAGARQYCGPDGNPNDPICSCINSKVSKYNPACVDSFCATSGYLTSTQSALQCPNIVDCSIVMALESGGTTVVGDVKQNCRAESSSNVGAPPPAPVEKTTNNLMIFLLIFVVIIMVGMAIGMYYIISNLNPSRK